MNFGNGVLWLFFCIDMRSEEAAGGSFSACYASGGNFLLTMGDHLCYSITGNFNALKRNALKQISKSLKIIYNYKRQKVKKESRGEKLWR